MADSPEYTRRGKLYRGITKHLGDSHRRLSTLSHLLQQVSTDIYRDEMLLSIGLRQSKAISQQLASFEQTLLMDTQTDNPVGWCVIIVITTDEKKDIRSIHCVGPFLDKDKASEYASLWNGLSCQAAITWVNTAQFQWITPSGQTYVHKSDVNDRGYWILELSHTTPYGWTECHQTMIGPFSSKKQAEGYRLALESTHRHVLTIVSLKPASPQVLEKKWTLPMWESCHQRTKLSEADVVRLCGATTVTATAPEVERKLYFCNDTKQVIWTTRNTESEDKKVTVQSFFPACRLRYSNNEITVPDSFQQLHILDIDDLITIGDWPDTLQSIIKDVLTDGCFCINMATNTVMYYTTNTEHVNTIREWLNSAYSESDTVNMRINFKQFIDVYPIMIESIKFEPKPMQTPIAIHFNATYIRYTR